MGVHFKIYVKGLYGQGQIHHSFVVLNNQQAKLEDKYEQPYVTKLFEFQNYIHSDDILFIRRYSISKDGWFSGQLIKRYKNTNQKEFIVNFKDGKFVGISKGWYQCGSLHYKINHETESMIRYYQGGQKEYINKRISTNHPNYNKYFAVRYNTNGGLNFKTKYTENSDCVLDRWDDYYFSWFSNGKLSSSARHHKGYVLQQGWKAPGDVTNYYRQMKRIKFPNGSYYDIRHGISKYFTSRKVSIYKNNKIKREVFENNKIIFPVTKIEMWYRKKIIVK
jgi:antitoxin component YwqK of YwqJK toxin-antitoxin module